MIYIFAASVLYGLVHPGSKLILSQGIDPLSFSILYVLFRLLAQLPFVIKYKYYRVLQKQSWLPLLLIGLLGAGLQFTEFKGIASGLSVSLVTFLVYSHPIWSLLFSRVINSEPFELISFIRLALGLLGIFLILGSHFVVLDTDFDKLILPVIAGLFMALWVSLSNKAKKLGASSWSISFYYDLFALLGLLSLKLLSGFPGMSFYEVWSWVASPVHFGCTLIYSLAIGLLPNILFYRGNEFTTARAVGLTLLVEPIVATSVSHLIWFEQLSSSFFVGAIFILLTGVPMNNLKFNEMLAFLFRKIKPIRFLLLSLLVAGVSPECSTAMDSPAIHGMLVFGDSSIYFSHLPMFHSPHDYQIVFEANLRNSVNETFLKDQRSHPESIYTFIPTEMLLPDFGTSVKEIRGDLYRGHFEKNGILIEKSVVVQIKRMIHFQKLDGEVTRPANLKYLLVGDKHMTWLIHFISQRPDFDQILAVNSSYGASKNNSGMFVEFRNISNEKPIVDGQVFMGYIGDKSYYFSGLKTKYLEFEDLSR